MSEVRKARMNPRMGMKKKREIVMIIVRVIVNRQKKR
jgi:hypothetical protein